MSMRVKIQEALKAQYGEFETHLEHVYEHKIIEILVEGDIGNKKAWLTYNQVILELKHSIKDTLKLKELQYKLTDKFDPNIACIQVIKNVKHRSPELDRLYHKIKNFI